MKRKEISALQMFYVLITFEVGTAVFFERGAQAKQDAWLSILVAMLCGVLLMWIYTKLSKYYPSDTLAQMIPKIVGKFLGYPLVVIYILYFITVASRNCRDLGELIVLTILNETPITIIMGAFMVLIIYCLRGGVEVFGRMGEVVFPIYILVLFCIWILLFGSQLVNFERLTPILGGGIKPVWEAAFPDIVTFPFGELIIITMFFPVLNDKRKIKKVGMAVILIGGVLLTFSHVITLSVLGPNIYSRMAYPFFAAARMISIADFLERIDTLVILMMVAGVFFKVGCWTYGAVAATAQLFKLKGTHFLLIPFGTIIPPITLITLPSVTEYVASIKVFMYYAHIPLQIVIPSLLLAVAFIRKKMQL